MKTEIYFTVYELNRIDSLNQNLYLEKIEFKGLQSNLFSSKEEAIQALIKGNRTYEEFVILEHVRIDEFEN